MAHFARLENNIVVDVHVVDNVNLLDENGIEQEQKGIDYLKSLWGDHTFLQCSYNSTIRKRYPGIGYSYDAVNDLFIAPQPYPSWVLNDNFDWEAPVAMPDLSVLGEREAYNWNEEIVNWELVKLPF